MSIDVIRDAQKYEKQIVEWVKVRKGDYYNSNASKKLKKRYRSQMDSYNMKLGDQNQWMSKVAFPLVKEQMLLRRSITKQNYRSDPLIGLEPVNETPRENAVNMQDLLGQNYRATQFRYKSLNPTINFCSIVGVTVLFSYFKIDQSSHFRTVMTEVGAERKREQRYKKGIHHFHVNPLNYFQDAASLNAYDSPYAGHISRDHLTDLQVEVGSGRYIEENLKKVLKELYDGISKKDVDYYAGNETDIDTNKHVTDIVHCFTRLNFKGNEDDDLLYYIEIAGDTLIRLQAEIYDDGINPYTIFNFDKHVDYWWGNADSEYRKPHENFTNLLMGIAADNVIQSTQRIRIYDPNKIKILDINNRHKNNGWIKGDLSGSRNVDDIFKQVQNTDNSLNSVEFIMRYIQQSAQQISTKTDFFRQQNQGGPANNTATAAGIMENTAAMLDSDLLESFNFGLQEMAGKDVIMLMQFLGDAVRIRPKVNEVSKVITRPEYQGEYDYIIRSSMQRNNLMEATRLNQALTMLINMANSGRPEFQNMNIVEAVQNWLRALDIGDPEKILPAGNEFQNPNYVQSDNQAVMNGQGAAPAMPGQPAQPAPPAQPLQGGAPNAPIAQAA